MAKLILIIIVIGLLVFLAYKGVFNLGDKLFQPENTFVLTSDTTIKGNYLVEKNKKVVLKNGVKLTVEGRTEVNGILSCEDGPVNLESKGDLVVGGTLLCNRKEDQVKKDSAEAGINLIIGDSAEFTKDSILVSNAHLQIVEREDLLLKTPADFKKAFNEVAVDAGEGIRIGPLLAQALNRSGSGQAPPKAYDDSLSVVLAESTDSGAVKKDKRVNLRGKVKIGVSMGSPDQSLPGWIDLKNVPKELDYILFWAAIPNGVLNMEDMYIFTPDGHDGQDITGGCNIDIPKTEDPEDSFKRNAMRMRAKARQIRIRNVYLFLGDGGRGGNATTDKKCDPGIARAGMGGNGANFKFTADEGIEILGGFYIEPGKGGDGGKAIAYGDNGETGCPGKDGKKAFAYGGTGAANPRALKAQGNVKGLDNIYIGSLIGGNGGDAEVYPGTGGKGNECDCLGGQGGEGVAVGGKGGSVSLTYPQGVKRTNNAKDEKGQDGKAVKGVGEKGEDGSKCPGKAAATPKPKTDQVGSGSDYADGFFEFLDSATGQPSIAFSTTQKPHIIVAADSGRDVRNWLPIRIEIKKDGNSFWSGKIDGDPQVVCRGPSGCSTDGPSGIGDNWKKIEIVAYDKNGKLVATFTETYNPR